MFKPSASWLTRLYNQWRQPIRQASAQPASRRSLRLEILEERITPDIGTGFLVGDIANTSGTSQANAVATDSSGNVYITGYFTGTLLGKATAQGSEDAFVAKYSSGGTLDWVVAMGGAQDTTAGNGIAVDSAGNVYTTGSFQGTTPVSFGGGTAILSGDGGYDASAYVSKLSSSGAFVFGVELGYSPNSGSQQGDGFGSEGNAIAVDSAANVYTTGSFNGSSLEFDPAGNTNDTLSSSGSSVGTDTNAYVSKLTSTGAFVFAKELAYADTSNDEANPLDVTSQGNGIALDSGGNIYTTGSFQGTAPANFDPSAQDTHQLTSSNNGQDQSAFVSKLTSSGAYSFAVELGNGGTTTSGSAIAVDSSGVYTTGVFTGTNVNFGATDVLSSSNDGANSTAYVSKLTTSGSFGFGVEIGYGTASGITSQGKGIALDGSHNVFSTGSFTGADVNFDPSTQDSSSQLSSADSGNDSSAFVSELNSSGAFVDAAGSSSTSTSGDTAIGDGIAVDKSGNVYATGLFTGNLKIGSNTLNGGGSSALFLSKFAQDSGLTINTNSLPNGQSGTYYSATISVSGGSGYTFTVTQGSLPNGLQLNPSSGQIAGTPTSAGTVTFTITVTDANNDTDYQTFTVTIAAAIVPSIYAPAAYNYAYYSYVYAYSAFVSGTGSYTAYYDAYYSFIYAYYASIYNSSGNTGLKELYAYYAYYYGYYASATAYDDYYASGLQSLNSYYAYYYGFFDWNYSYDTASGD